MIRAGIEKQCEGNAVIAMLHTGTASHRSATALGSIAAMCAAKKKQEENMNSEVLKAFIRRTFRVAESEFDVLRHLIRELDLLEFEESRNREATEHVE